MLDLRNLMRTLRRLVNGHGVTADRVSSHTKTPHVRLLSPDEGPGTALDDPAGRVRTPSILDVPTPRV